MKSAIKLFVVLILTTITEEVFGQNGEEKPYNFAGISGVIIFGHTSATIGLEYERYLLMKNRYVIGVRSGHLLRYHGGNFSICFSEECGSTSSASYSHWQAAITCYVFTSAQKKFSGFFLHGAAGLTYSQVKDFINDPAPSIYKASSIVPGFDLGLGFQFPLNKRLVCRLTNSWSLYLPKKYEYGLRSEESPGDILAIKIAIGF